MYESTIAGAFLYTWGAHDQFRHRIGQNAVISNAQNPLDHLLGDLVVRADDDRWFIAELKQDKKGFEKEVWIATPTPGAQPNPPPKPHRRMFLIDLGAPYQSNQKICISSRAHFAVWVNECDFQIAEYVCMAAPGLLSPNLPPPHPNKSRVQRLTIPSPGNFLRGTVLQFSDFYDDITLHNSTRHPLCKAIFSHGLGVPFDTMLKYIERLVKYEKKSTDAAIDATYILGCVSTTGPASFKPVCGSSFEGLLKEMQDKVKIVTNNQPDPPRKYSNDTTKFRKPKF